MPACASKARRTSSPRRSKPACATSWRRASLHAAGPEPHVEADPLDAQTRGSVIELERLTTQSPPLVGCALRFGLLYGPGTWYAEPFGTSPVHVDAAAYATLLAIEQRAPGIFNIAEELGYASSARARALLGWTPAYRITS